MEPRDGLPDEAIVRSVLGGDVEAYGLLVERYRARLFGLALHLCGDYDAAADLAQDTLVTAYECLDRIRNPSTFAQWIAGILRNKFRNLARANPAPTVSLDQMVAAGFDPPNPDTGPAVAEVELRQAVECVWSLPEIYREVLLLRYAEDLSYKEMAEFLGLPVTTVTTRLTYARRLVIKKAKESGLL
jgi:RNA polymerase sigma-70 factor (ECF subfamily)